MEKISTQQVAQLAKTAAATVRALSEENVSLRKEHAELVEKVASFQKKERAEKIASQMEAKDIESGLSFQEKVAAIMQKTNLDAFEEAIGLVAPQTKLASLADDKVSVENTGSDSEDSSASTDAFAAALATLE